jgi:hypothetical protein
MFGSSHDWLPALIVVALAGVVFVQDLSPARVQHEVAEVR